MHLKKRSEEIAAILRGDINGYDFKNNERFIFFDGLNNPNYCC